MHRRISKPKPGRQNVKNRIAYYEQAGMRSRSRKDNITAQSKLQTSLAEYSVQSVVKKIAALGNPEVPRSDNSLLESSRCIPKSKDPVRGPELRIKN
jgi:hypothetical protein